MPDEDQQNLTISSVETVDDTAQVAQAVATEAPVASPNTAAPATDAAQTAPAEANAAPAGTPGNIFANATAVARKIAQDNLHKREQSSNQAPFWQEKVENKALTAGLSSVRDIIAPAAFVVTPNYLQIGDLYCKTLFVFTYPRYLETNWLSPIINYDITMDIGMYIHPLESKDVMYDLKKQIGKLESSRQIDAEKGNPRDPELETALGDIDALRDVLQRGEIRLFQFGLYFTVYGHTPEELHSIVEQLESTLGGMLIYSKESMLQMEEGFTSTMPLMYDQIDVLRNLDTGSLSSTFPFTSSELSQDDGILYGINRHNNSLIIFDRFHLENANTVVFAKSGAGKSYAIKLEILRYLMMGTDVIIVDPENEYKTLCDAVGGNYLVLSLGAKHRINPFDLPAIKDNSESGEDVLRSAIASLHGLVNLMAGGLSAEEDAIVDKALFETYALKDITYDPDSQKNEAPLMQDLYNVLTNMYGTESLCARLSKFVEGTYANMFNQPTNFELSSGFVVFSVRDMEDQLRPIAMYMILNYIWTTIRAVTKRRIMVIDEAWWMMQYEDSAKFLHGLVKRARKYYLGVTVISQDVEDFLGSRYGKAVVSNASMQLLMKQSTSSIDIVAETFGLTEGEKYLLLESDVGEGLFFAGMNHVAIKIVASYAEDQIITTDPKQLLGEG